MLGPMELIAIFFVFGCPTWILSKLIDRAFAGRHRGQPGTKDALEAQERARALELQLLDARIQHDQLQKQLDWHTKMLAAQDSPKPRARDAIADTIVQPG